MESIPGLEDSPLNDIAGMWLWTGFYICAAGVGLGAVMLGLGKIRRKSGWTVTGAIALPIGLVGAVVLGNMNGAIQWSSSKEYTMQALPEDAQTRSITVEKNPPKVTCTKEIEYSISSTDGKDGPEHQEVYEVLTSVVSDEDAQKIRDTPLLNRISYMPQGPDCSKENRVAKQCTKVQVHWTERKTHVRGGAQDFPKTDEYQSRDSKDC